MAQLGAASSLLPRAGVFGRPSRASLSWRCLVTARRRRTSSPLLTGLRAVSLGSDLCTVRVVPLRELQPSSFCGAGGPLPPLFIAGHFYTALPRCIATVSKSKSPFPFSFQSPASAQHSSRRSGKGKLLLGASA